MNANRTTWMTEFAARAAALDRHLVLPGAAWGRDDRTLEAADQQ